MNVVVKEKPAKSENKLQKVVALIALDASQDPEEFLKSCETTGGE